ncbi:MAG: hypothetical protein WBD20_22935 [Pirellulaceae bacterium]
MKSRPVSLLTALLFVFAFSFIGCSDGEPKSVTDGLEQSEIDAYKAKEKQIEEDAMKDMELGQ